MLALALSLVRLKYRPASTEEIPRPCFLAMVGSPCVTNTDVLHHWYIFSLSVLGLAPICAEIHQLHDDVASSSDRQLKCA